MKKHNSSSLGRVSIYLPVLQASLPSPPPAEQLLNLLTTLKTHPQKSKYIFLFLAKNLLKSEPKLLKSKEFDNPWMKVKSWKNESHGWKSGIILGSYCLQYMHTINFFFLFYHFHTPKPLNLFAVWLGFIFELP